MGIMLYVCSFSMEVSMSYQTKKVDLSVKVHNKGGIAEI